MKQRCSRSHVPSESSGEKPCLFQHLVVAGSPRLTGSSLHSLPSLWVCASATKFPSYQDPTQWTTAHPNQGG